MATQTQTSSVSSPKVKTPRTVEQVERDIARVELALRPEALAEEGGTRNAIRKREKRLQEKLVGLREELNSLGDSPTSETEKTREEEFPSSPESIPEPIPEPVRDPKVPTNEFIDWPTAPYRVHFDSPESSQRSHMVDRHIWESLCGRYQIIRGFDLYRGGEEATQLRIQAQYKRPSGTGDRWAWVETPKGRDGRSLGNYPVLYTNLEAAFQAVRVFHEKTTGVFPVDNQEEVLIAARQRGISSNGTIPPRSGGAKETDMTTTTTDTMDLTLEQARSLILAVGGDEKLNSAQGERAQKQFQISLNAWARPKVQARVKDIEIEDEEVGKLRDEVLSHLEGGGKVKVILHVSDIDSSESNGETDEESPTPKGKKGKKSAAPKGEKTKPSNGGLKSKYPPVYGVSPIRVIHWMGQEGYTMDEVKAALAGLKVEILESTLRTAWTDGKNPKYSRPADLTREQREELASLAGREAKPKKKKAASKA